jgi:hypothetical protein
MIINLIFNRFDKLLCKMLIHWEDMIGMRPDIFFGLEFLEVGFDGKYLWVYDMIEYGYSFRYFTFYK